MMKHRGLTLIISIILAFVLAVGVFADGDTNTAYTVTVPTLGTGTVSLKEFSLNVTPNFVKVDQVTGFAFSFFGRAQNWPNQFEYTLKVPSGTSSVTIQLVSTATDGFILEETPNNPNFTTINAGVASIPSNAITETKIELDSEGNGSSKLIFPYAKNSKGKYSYENSNVFRFVVVAESSEHKFTSDLPDETTYYLGDTAAPLSVAIDAENVTYQWFSGSSAASINQEITGATTNTYTPDISKLGVTYYQVKATFTPEDGTPVELTSKASKVVVKARNVGFAPSTYDKNQLVKEAGSDIYSFQMAAANNLSVFTGKITGTIPDGVTIERVCSGLSVDQFNLTKDGAINYNYDLNTFTLNLGNAVDESITAVKSSPTWKPYHHGYARCLYIQTSENKIYTIVADNDRCSSGFQSVLPELVQLTDQNGTTITGSEVTGLQNASTKTSVIHQTITADEASVLRAQVKNGGKIQTQYRVKDGHPGNWNEIQQNWVVVNGQKIGGNFYGVSDGVDGESPAFALQPGLNVVEVYTNVQPLAFNNNYNAELPGLNAQLSYKGYTYELMTTCAVVYLIDYQGTSAAVPAEDTTTDLANVLALRYGDGDDYIAACPIVWDESEKSYVLTVPETFNTNTPSATSKYYTHAVLLAAKPKMSGATSTFAGANGLVVGSSVANCAFLNMEALYGTENPSFTITVTAGSETKDYTVKVKYASSETKPGITVENAGLDNEYSEEIYTYYLEFKNASAPKGKMTVIPPAGSTVTVNGTAYTAPVTLDPKEDFYRVTVTAADGLNTSSYYFVTRYEDGTMPYMTPSAKSEELAEEMLSGWYDALEGSKNFGNYWRIFMAKATGNKDGSEFDFNKTYVKDPARHEMKQATDWAACIMEIVMLGRNPYDFPRYENGKLNEHCNYVQGLIDCGGGAYANDVWYHMATKAAGAPQKMLEGMKLLSLQTTYDLDTRAWAIASLVGCVEPKDIILYVDSLHDAQETSGTYASLWKNQSWHSASSGNSYTIGCVISAIAASGADPDRLFAYGSNTPLQTIKDVMYKDGLFYSNGSRNGVLPKDMIIGLGDILHGSNVWARYALTEQKYNDLIAKARENGLAAEADAMPPYKAEDTAVGKAYYDLYDDVADALEAKGDYSMRPQVTFGMPYELFTDAVNAMPAALTQDDLASLEALIAQYEAMDEANLVGVDKATLTKYHSLVKQGLALKAEGTSADTARISKIYDEIIALPAASEITESNVEATLAKVTEIEREIGTLSEEEKSLLTWMDNSLLQKLEDIKKAAPKPDITVTFTLLGDTHHTITDDSNIHSYRFNAGPVWVEETTVTVAEGSTVGDVFKQVLDKNGLMYTGLDKGYIDSITYTDNTTLTAKDDSRDKSGWLYLVQPKDGKATHPNVGLNAYELSDGDKIIWHWSDDYQIEQGSEHWSSSRVVDYVANLYDLAEMEQDAAAKAELQKKADAAYGVLGSEAELLPLQSQVETLRAVRKSVRDVTALIKEITDWTVPAGYSNERTDVVKWVQDKLNTELADQLDGVSVTASIGVYDITPSKPGVDGKFTATIYLSKEVTADSVDKLSSKNELTIKGVLKASAALSSDSSVSSVTVCNTPATASEDGNTYTVTVPYGSTVTAASFTITLSSDAASVTAGPAETEESGVWTFTVTAENGTTADYTVKVLVAADPAEGNKAAVDAAKAMLEKASFIYASKDVNTEAAAKAAVERQIGALFGDADISYEITMTGFTAAVDGTLWSEPTNGSFSFTVKLTKGENDSYAEATESLTGTITAASKPVTPPTPSKPTKPATKPTDEPAKPDASKFVDVSKNNWYFDAVQYVLENGLMNGTSANEFNPNANTTRSMIVTILARMEGVNTSGGATWYAAGREWAMGAGISDGTNMTGKITREQLAAMLYRYAKMKGYDVSASASLSGYTDASSVSGWAKEAMQWAVGSGLIQGSGNALTPQANASRAQIATILMRFAQSIAK